MLRGNKHIKWKKKVLKRDKCCVICKTKDNLEAHHLYSYRHYPDKRYSVRNGVTLCSFHHELFHTSYMSSYREKTTRKKFKNFIELLNKIEEHRRQG